MPIDITYGELSYYESKQGFYPDIEEPVPVFLWKPKRK